LEPLIAAGVAVNLISGFRHFRLVRMLDRDQVTRPHAAGLAVAVAIFLAMAIYLISVRNTASVHSENREEVPANAWNQQRNRR
jgi:hypothetical protein